jgi:hypothetical protein
MFGNNQLGQNHLNAKNPATIEAGGGGDKYRSRTFGILENIWHIFDKIKKQLNFTKNLIPNL